jgi:ATP-dependent exoDNAse (exonuclease V) beta subunit
MRLLIKHDMLVSGMGVNLLEEPHVYYVHGDPNNVSVTTLVHQYFPKFDADLVISRMMASKNWPNNKYYGMTAAEIKQQWTDTGNEATTKGTRMHLSIELFYNDVDVSEYENDREFHMFKEFYEDHKDRVSPYRTEWEVYDETHKIAGSIDMVFQNTDGSLSIYDWKRSKEIKIKNTFGGRGFDHLKDYHDCNYVHYSLQLNIYKYILEKHYGKKIRDLYLVVMHPMFERYQKFECMDLQDVVEKIFADRRNCLDRKDKFT